MMSKVAQEASMLAFEGEEQKMLHAQRFRIQCHLSSIESKEAKLFDFDEKSTYSSATFLLSSLVVKKLFQTLIPLPRNLFILVWGILFEVS